MVRLLSAISIILFSTSTFALDMPRMTVADFIQAFTTREDTAERQKRDVMVYLSGVRDHLWWQCEYKMTTGELAALATSYVSVFKRHSEEGAFRDWAKTSKFGDIVFIALNDEAVTGKQAPCKR